MFFTKNEYEFMRGEKKANVLVDKLARYHDITRKPTDKEVEELKELVRQGILKYDKDEDRYYFKRS